MQKNEFEVVVCGYSFILLDSKKDAVLKYMDSIGQGKGKKKKAKSEKKDK